jgi:integrase
MALRLTAKRVGRLLKKRPGRHHDGHGLYLQVVNPTSASWLLRYVRDGRERMLGLGPVHTVGLAEARTRAKAARLQLLDGIDPVEDRKAAKAARALAAAKMMTFKECAEAYIVLNRAAWKNPKHGQQWTNTLETYVYPHIGHLPVAAIDTGLVLKCIEPIWRDKTETASRVRGRIESVLDWATVRGYRKGDNPARWSGLLEHALPAKGKVSKVEHFPALPYVELPAFMQELRQREGLAALALEFTILTSVRTGDIIANNRDDKPPMRWPHVNLHTRVWTIPNTKTETEHRVPLNDAAVRLLKEIKALELSGDVVFQGQEEGEPLSNMAMTTVIRRINDDRTATGAPRYVDPKQQDRDVTVHGFRSTFRDWAAEQTNYPNHVVEMALAHVIDSKVEAAYRRGDLLKKRFALAEAWARYCSSRPVAQGAVVPLRRPDG